MGTYADAHLFNTSYKQGVQDGRVAMMNQLNQTLVSKGIAKFPLDTSLAVSRRISTYNGFVKTVDEEAIILDINTNYVDPLNGKRFDKKIIIDNKTEIVEVINKPPSETDGVNNNGMPPERPLAGTSRMFPTNPAMLEVAEQQTIQLSDIKYGDYVLVTTDQADFIKDDELVARQIKVYELENNSYAETGVPTYENLPMGFTYEGKKNIN